MGTPTVSTVEKLRVGDRVYVDCIDGFGGPATIIEDRGPAEPFTRFKVAMEDGNPPPFWAHDQELSVPAGDSRPDTLRHINQVRFLLRRAINDLERREDVHDASKLVSPEVEAFDEYTPKLAATTYGSDEYRSYLAAMRPALDHHYAANDHHPEFHGVDVCVQCGAKQSVCPCTCGGPLRASVEGMSLLSLVEMLCDWKAATLRHDDGDVRRSIEQNQKRFGYSDELKQILLNTLAAIEDPCK